MIVVPDFFDAVHRVENGTATAIDKFVYENEPAGAEDEVLFRQLLQDALNEAFAAGETSAVRGIYGN